MKILRFLVVVVGVLVFEAPTYGVPPVVTNVAAKQRNGTKLIDITYDLDDQDSKSVAVTIDVSQDGGNFFDVPVSTLSGDFGSAVTPGVGKKIVWNVGLDWRERYTQTAVVRITAVDEKTDVPKGMVLVPGGSFVMGDTYAIESIAVPVRSVDVSAFYMDKYEVFATQWNETYDWAVNKGGYKFTRSFYPVDRGPDFPVESVLWYDAVKWCNARSEREGLTPAYYKSATFNTQTVYRTGDIDVLEAWVQWTTNGYRLPTEAEWEKAARGGLKGQNFPWVSNGANFPPFFLKGYANWSDSGDAWGSNASLFTAGIETTPVGGYNGVRVNPGGLDMANGFGLYDMAGNVREWCWDGFRRDWYNSDPTPARDTHGPWPPVEPRFRVVRSGGWPFNPGPTFRCAGRDAEAADHSPPQRDIGFRTVRRK